MSASVWQLKQVALLRLQLYVYGATHRMLSECASRCRAEITRFEYLDGLGLSIVQPKIETIWQDTFSAWSALFETARKEAVRIAFGMLATEHRQRFGGLLEGRRGASVGQMFNEEEGDGPIGITTLPFFDPQLKALMDAANQRVYDDGLKLSQRIWNLDDESMDGIRQVLYQGVADGDSAWNIAKKLEQYLGAGQDIPRWTHTRLYGLTKEEIAAGDLTGLYSTPGSTVGVAYNALRLARTEIQYIHALATDRILEHLPWVEMEKIHLSPSHAEIGCACEDVVDGGDNGDGVYEKGTIDLPLHPNCLCWKEGVSMPADEFTRKLRDWMNGGSWPGMDAYAEWIGMSPSSGESAFLAGLESGLEAWPWGNEDELDAIIAEAA